MKKHIALAGVFALGAAEACSPAAQTTAPAKAADTAQAAPAQAAAPAIVQEAPAAKEFLAAECPIVEVKSCMDHPQVLADKEALKTRTVEINGQKQVVQGEFTGVHTCQEQKSSDGRLEKLKYELTVAYDITSNPNVARLTERFSQTTVCVPNYMATSCSELLVCHKGSDSKIIRQAPLSERDRTRRDGGPISPKQ